MIRLLSIYLRCELRHKINLLSHVVIVLCSYFILQMGMSNANDKLLFIHALVWFVCLYLMLLVALDMSHRYRSNDFEKGLVCFTQHGAHLFYSKVIVHMCIMASPLAVIFFLLFLQGIHLSWQTYAVYVLGTILLACLGQLLSALLAQLPNKNLALPLLVFPISSPAVLFLYSVTVKSISIHVYQELLSTLGMVLVALSFGQLCGNINLEES